MITLSATLLQAIKSINAMDSHYDAITLFREK